MEESANTKGVVRNDFNFWLVYFYCFSIAIVFLFFFGLNSPIHTFNSHCDYNWFLTMGRGLLVGKVPYRDLFEQKGPITYFLYAVAALFPNPQVMVWFFEVICISLFLFFGYQIARRFLSPWLSLAAVPVIMMMLSVNATRGIEGSTVEEFCLPIFAYGLLCFLDFLMGAHVVTWRRSLAVGVCLGILFWTKFLMWEFFFVPMLIWVILNLVRHNLGGLLRSGLIMIGGILLITLPVLIYFGVVGGLSDLWQVYFLTNICTYTGNKTTSLWEHFFSVEPWKNNLFAVFIGFYFLIFFLIGIISFTIHYRKQKGWLLLLGATLTWIMVGFFCGYIYYYIPLFAYGILGAVYVVKGFAHCMNQLGVIVQRRWVCAKLLGLVTVLAFVFALPGVVNLSEINRPRDAYAPLVVADIIADYNQTAEEPATLFCYQMSDCGFYNAAGLIPNIRYYAQNSFTEESFPEMYAAFDETIRNQVCDFVVTYENVFQEKQDLLLQYYDFYYGSLEDSTLPFVFFEPWGYIESKIVLLLRK